MTAPDIARLPRLNKAKGPEARASEIVADNALQGLFRYAPGLGWLAWDGTRWAARESSEPRARRAVREFADATERGFRTAAALAEARAIRVAVAVQARKAGATDAAATQNVEDMTAKDRSELVQASGKDNEKREYEQHERDRRSESEQADVWLNLLSAASLRNLLALAGDRPGILTETTEFDRHPDLLNCSNGVVDLRTGKLLGHDPGLLLTKMTAGPYLPEAVSPEWTAALQALAPGCLEWFRTRMGQTATGHRPDDDVMFICWGSGANGKSTVLTAVQTALGDYAGTIPHKVLLQSDPNAHTTELMNFRGLRMAVMEELPEEGHLNMQRVKATVGTARIKARLMRRDDVEFPTTHCMWISTNHAPQVSTTDHGTWRRLVAVPWPYRFVKPGTEQGREDRPGDVRLRPALIDEPAEQTTAAIIRWLVAGAMAWYAAGRVSPELPEAVARASARWREDSDVTLQFIRDHLVPDAHGFVLGPDMREAFNQFLTEQGKHSWSAQTFRTRLVDSLAAEGIQVTATPEKNAKVRAGDCQSTRALNGRGLEPGKQGKFWRGVRFRTTADPVAAEDELGHLHAV